MGVAAIRAVGPGEKPASVDPAVKRARYRIVAVGYNHEEGRRKALLYQEGECQPWIVAFGFADKPDRFGWDFGHYFPSEEDARKDYAGTCCEICLDREGCIHRGAFRRLPKSEGGLGLCPNLC